MLVVPEDDQSRSAVASAGFEGEGAGLARFLCRPSTLSTAI
jgi:hypothetical protein